MTSFEKFYNSFLNNGFQGKKFRITLTTGEVAVGVPTAGSIANPTVDGRVFGAAFETCNRALFLQDGVEALQRHAVGRQIADSDGRSRAAPVLDFSV